jgi:chemotaxis protein methyltransferase CheR
MLEPSIVKDEEVEYLIKDVYDMYGYDFPVTAALPSSAG